MKNARPTEVKTSAREQGDSRQGARVPRIHIDAADFRARRALLALAERPRSREELDRIAGAANGPDLILRLRMLGLALPCTRLSFTDRDGKPVRPGSYATTDRDRALIRHALALPIKPTRAPGVQGSLPFPDEGTDG